MSPSIEYTLSNAISFGAAGSSAASNSSRCARSLWRNTRFSQPELRMPAIIDAWFSSSEKMMQPGKTFASVAKVASFDTYPLVNSKAASLPCRSASSPSRSTW